MSSLLLLLMYAGIGGIAGFFAGLLGIGGGAIIVPLLLIIYTNFLEFSPLLATHMAVATASAIIVLTAPVSAFAHARRGNVNWRLVRRLSIGAMAGAVAGVYGAAQSPPLFLKVLLSVFLLITAISLLLPPRRSTKTAAAAGTAPALSGRELLPFATGVGALSAVLGIGGGAMMVPYLHHRGCTIRQAIGSSACVGFPLALAAAVSYIFAGSRAAVELPPASLGYIYLPALFGVALFSMLAATAGARLTGVLPAVLLRKIFAGMALFLSLHLLFDV